MESVFMNSLDHGSTEHRSSPGMSRSYGRHPACRRPAGSLRFVARLLFAAFLVLLFVVPAAGNVSPEATAAAPGNVSVENSASAAGNVSMEDTPATAENALVENNNSPVGNVTQEGDTTLGGTPARNAPEETDTPEEAVTEEESVSLEEIAIPEESDTPVVNITKEYVDNLMLKGSACFEKRDYTCAWNYYEDAHQADPKRWAPLYVQSLILVNRGNTTGAIEKMDEVLVLFPNSASMWKIKGDLLNSAGRYTESDACFDRAKALNPRISIPLAHRFPYNMGMKNLMLIVVTIGFLVLGIYIFFREFRQ
jgi:tetratricopeptide (TPR) repeat protein